ncbi:hypothetical protein [Aurantivibrio plasticivorans]
MLLLSKPSTIGLNLFLFSFLFVSLCAHSNPAPSNEVATPDNSPITGPQEAANGSPVNTDKPAAIETKNNQLEKLTSLLPTYGNWCGANHPVNMQEAEEPIDGLDTACKRHDMCYAEKGYLDCECDSQFRDEVEQGILSGEYQGNEEKIARSFRIYFHGSPCQGDASGKIAPSRDIHNIVKKVTKVGKKVATDIAERVPFAGKGKDDQ